MGIGPILLFDKSLIHSLSVDEAVWLDTFYFPCVTPLFFVEVLADLEKEVKQGRTPEDVVGNLAEKTPLGGGINVHHHTLCVNELLGAGTIEMRHFPVVGGGARVKTGSGKGALVYDPPPEAVARERWEEGNFLDVERRFAKSWRDSLSEIDLNALFNQGRSLIRQFGRPRDLAAARTLASEILAKPGSRYVRDTLESFKPSGLRDAIVERWNTNGAPPIKQFAPYSAHVFLADLFFCLGLGADLIGRERPSNKVDLAYLYYLPFCMVFTSTDNLHARTVPLLMDNDQAFVWGHDMKSDLAKLDAHYSKLPDEEKAKGVMKFAHYPPLEGDFLVTKLWDKLMSPDWRKHATVKREPMSKDDEREIVDEINKIANAERTPEEVSPSGPQPEAMVVRRTIPFRRGKWQMVPTEVLNKAK